LPWFRVRAKPIGPLPPPPPISLTCGKQGTGHPTDRRWPAIPDVGRRIEHSSATGLDYMQPVWPSSSPDQTQHRPARRFLEPDRTAGGQVRFTVLDGVIQGARSHNMRLVLLWFGIGRQHVVLRAGLGERDFARFPRAQDSKGETLELLTPFSDAEPRGRYSRLHGFDAARQGRRGQQHTVINGPVENEGNARRLA